MGRLSVYEPGSGGLFFEGGAGTLPPAPLEEATRARFNEFMRRGVPIPRAHEYDELTSFAAQRKHPHRPIDPHHCLECWDAARTLDKVTAEEMDVASFHDMRRAPKWTRANLYEEVPRDTLSGGGLAEVAGHLAAEAVQIKQQRDRMKRASGRARTGHALAEAAQRAQATLQEQLGEGLRARRARSVARGNRGSPRWQNQKGWGHKKQRGGLLITLPLIGAISAKAALVAGAKAAALGAISGAASYGIQAAIRGSTRTVVRREDILRALRESGYKGKVK